MTPITTRQPQLGRHRCHHSTGRIDHPPDLGIAPPALPPHPGEHIPTGRLEPPATDRWPGWTLTICAIPLTAIFWTHAIAGLIVVAGFTLWVITRAIALDR